MNKNFFILFFSAITLFFTFSLSANGNDEVRELMRYKIRYGFLNGGEVEYRTQIEEYKDKPVYHTRVDAKTTGFIDQLYKLHDIYESYYDVQTGLPELAIQNLSEGKYRHYDEVSFFQEQSYASSKKRETTFLLFEPTYDILSAIEHLRGMNWDNFMNGDTITIITAYDKDPFPIHVIYRGKETITIGDYKYKCHKFAPIIDPGKILKKKESILIWFSDDENKIPVNIRLNLVVGAFKLELEETPALLHPFTAKSHKKNKK
ncbi:DUF3108 domain-containing protein [Paludibacteraceae bacterium OttesenSCG-928-F17]|nr:DUF3108 domain-containing protein [Paludibacteraceae bacterium OttesenSCG-928-F17]